jgi:type II secretory pathway predicted ATPase ExeA
MADMYEQHFRLTGRPFRGTLPGHAAFAVPVQEHILDQLVETFQAGEGVAILQGEAGTGKTFLARRLADCLAEEFLIAWVVAHPADSRTDLQQAILYEVGLPHRSRTTQGLRLRLTDLLLENAQKSRSMLLIVDDAHHLEMGSLEELRQWGNLGAPHDRLFQALLVGQLGLKQTLRQTALESMRQQIAAWFTLEPWDEPTAVRYLKEHVHAVGGGSALLSGEAIHALVAHAGGVPRLLNQAANRAFWLAAIGGADTVDLEAVWEAFAELRGDIVAAEDALHLEKEEETDISGPAPPSALTVPHPMQHKAAG